MAKDGAVGGVDKCQVQEGGDKIKDDTASADDSKNATKKRKMKSGDADGGVDGGAVASQNAGKVVKFEMETEEPPKKSEKKKGKPSATEKTMLDYPTGKEDAHITAQPAKHKEAPEKIEKKKKSKQTKGTPKARPHPTGKEDAHIPSQPDTQFPPGWTVRRIPRPKGKQRDTRYYSPIEDYKFKTKKEVKLFLQKLDEANGDEKAALVLFKKKDDVKMKDGKTTPQDEDGYLSSPITV